MRASTAYFAGAGTVIAAIVGGVGGGLLIADIVSPKSPRQEMTRLEQRMSSQPIQAAAAPQSPAPTEATIAPAAAPPAEIVAATQTAAPAGSSEVPPSSQPPAQKQAAASPEDSVAKARDVDIKRAAADKRRSERRQQWSEKRRAQQRQQQELREVEEKVREETETRPILASEPVRAEGPRIRLFDLD